MMDPQTIMRRRFYRASRRLSSSSSPPPPPHEAYDELRDSNNHKNNYYNHYNYNSRHLVAPEFDSSLFRAENNKMTRHKARRQREQLGDNNLIFGGHQMAASQEQDEAELDDEQDEADNSPASDIISDSSNFEDNQISNYNNNNILYSSSKPTSSIPKPNLKPNPNQAAPEIKRAQSRVLSESDPPPVNSTPLPAQITMRKSPETNQNTRISPNRETVLPDSFARVGLRPGAADSSSSSSGGGGGGGGGNILLLDNHGLIDNQGQGGGRYRATSRGSIGFPGVDEQQQQQHLFALAGCSVLIMLLALVVYNWFYRIRGSIRVKKQYWVNLSPAALFGLAPFGLSKKSAPSSKKRINSLDTTANDLEDQNFLQDLDHHQHHHHLASGCCDSDGGCIQLVERKPSPQTGSSRRSLEPNQLSKQQQQQQQLEDDQEIVHLETIQDEDDHDGRRAKSDKQAAAVRPTHSSIVNLRRKLTKSSLVIAAKSTKPRVKLITARMKKFIDDEAAELTQSSGARRNWSSRAYAILVTALNGGSQPKGGASASAAAQSADEAADGPGTELIERPTTTTTTTLSKPRGQFETDRLAAPIEMQAVRVELGPSGRQSSNNNRDESCSNDGCSAEQLAAAGAACLKQLKPAASPLLSGSGGGGANDACSSISACSLYSHSPIERDHLQQQQQPTVAAAALATSATLAATLACGCRQRDTLSRLFAASNQQQQLCLVHDNHLRSRSQGGHSPCQQLMAAPSAAVAAAALRPCCSASPSALMPSAAAAAAISSAGRQQQQQPAEFGASDLAAAAAHQPRLVHRHHQQQAATAMMAGFGACGSDSLAASANRSRPAGSRMMAPAGHSGKCSQRMKRHYENYYDEERGDAFRRLTASIGMELGFGFDASQHSDEHAVRMAAGLHHLGPAGVHHEPSSLLANCSPPSQFHAQPHHHHHQQQQQQLQQLQLRQACACCVGGGGGGQSRRQSHPSDMPNLALLPQINNATSNDGNANNNTTGSSQLNQCYSTGAFGPDASSNWCESGSEQLLSSASTSLGGSDSGFPSNADSYSFSAANQFVGTSAAAYCTNPQCSCQLQVGPANQPLNYATQQQQQQLQAELKGDAQDGCQLDMELAPAAAAATVDCDETETKQQQQQQQQQMKWHHRVRHLSQRRHLDAARGEASQVRARHSIGASRRMSIAGDRAPATAATAAGTDELLTAASHHNQPPALYHQQSFGGSPTQGAALLQHRASIAHDGCWSAAAAAASANRWWPHSAAMHTSHALAGHRQESIGSYGGGGGGGHHLQYFGNGTGNSKSNCSSSGGSSSGIGVTGSACTNTPTIATASAFPYGCFATRADLMQPGAAAGDWWQPAHAQLVQAYACQQDSPLLAGCQLAASESGPGCACPGRKFSLPVQLESPQCGSQLGERLSPNHKRLLFEKQRLVDSASIMPAAVLQQHQARLFEQHQLQQQSPMAGYDGRQQQQLTESRRSSQTITRQSSFWLEDNSLDSVLSLSSLKPTEAAAAAAADFGEQLPLVAGAVAAASQAPADQPQAAAAAAAAASSNSCRQPRRKSSNNSQRPSLGSLVLSGDSIESVRQRSVVMNQASLDRSEDVFEEPAPQAAAAAAAAAADSSSLGSFEANNNPTAQSRSSASGTTKEPRYSSSSSSSSGGGGGARKLGQLRSVAQLRGRFRSSSSSTTSSNTSTPSPDFARCPAKKSLALSSRSACISKRHLFGKLRARRYSRLAGSTSSEPSAATVATATATAAASAAAAASNSIGRAAAHQHSAPNCYSRRQRKRDESEDDDDEDQPLVVGDNNNNNNNSDCNQQQQQRRRRQAEASNSFELLDIEQQFMSPKRLERAPVNPFDQNNTTTTTSNNNNSNNNNSASLERQCRDLWKLRATLQDDSCAGDNWSNYHQRLNRRYDSGYKSIENQLSSSLEGNLLNVHLHQSQEATQVASIITGDSGGGGGGGVTGPTTTSTTPTSPGFAADAAATTQAGPIERPASGCSGLISKGPPPLVTCAEVDELGTNQRAASDSRPAAAGATGCGQLDDEPPATPISSVQAKLADLDLDDLALECCLLTSESGDRECQSRSSKSSNDEDKPNNN